MIARPEPADPLFPSKSPALRSNREARSSISRRAPGTGIRSQSLGVCLQSPYNADRLTVCRSLAAPPYLDGRSQKRFREAWRRIPPHDLLISAALLRITGVAREGHEADQRWEFSKDTLLPIINRSCSSISMTSASSQSFPLSRYSPIERGRFRARLCPPTAHNGQSSH